MDQTIFLKHNKVEKVGGDYQFVGHVVASFFKLNQTSMRYVVEDDRGVLHIYSAKNLRLVVNTETENKTNENKQ